MAHQEDYRGPRGSYGNEMQGRDMQGRGGMQGRGPDQYGMESGGDWQRQGERYGQGSNWQGQNRQGQGWQGQRWQGEQDEYGRGREGQGDQGQGGSWNENRWEQGRGGGAWQGGGRDYGWSPSQGYNTQPYSSGGYYGGGGYYGRESENPSYGNFNPGTYGGQQSGRGMGEGMQGGFGRQTHAGRGPRGYHRSDDRIREDVNEELTRHPEIDASEIEVRVEHAEVTLTGTVEDRHAKRLAEDIAERCSGVEDVRNELRVDRSGRERHDEHEGRSSRHGGMSDREVPRRTASETNRSEARSASGASGAGGTSGAHGDSESNRGRSASKSSS